MEKVSKIKIRKNSWDLLFNNQFRNAKILNDADIQIINIEKKPVRFSFFFNLQSTQ